MPYEREVEMPIGDGSVRVRFSHSGRPIERYSVVLVALVDGVWETIRVYDNHRGTHHMHRYTRQGGKQPEAPFHEGPTSAAIPAAIAHRKAHWEAILDSWNS